MRNMLKAADNSLLPVLRAQCTETIPARASGSRPIVPLERSRESDKHRRSTRIHGVTSPLRSSTVCVASQETAAVVVALEQRRFGHEELSSKSGSVRLKPTCCGAFGLDSRLGHP